MQKSAPFLGLATAVAALTGCATSVAISGESADAEVSSTATAIVVVEGTSGNDGPHATAVARFVKARGGAVDDDALRMVGVPGRVDFPAVGACSALAPAHAQQAHALALLDVGAVSLAAGNAVAPLARRQLPDVADLVSGVVYSARGDALPARGAYTLRVEGSSELDVAPFVVSAASPGEPQELRVAGVSVSSLSTSNDDARRDPIALAGGLPIEITWEPEGADDAVYVDVALSTGAVVTRCLYADAGRATLPASVLAGITLGDEGSLAVHRLHREPFRARGVDPGEVRFDFARVVPFVRR